MTPIYKKDDPHEISNYRPISILSSISKIIEKIVYNRLYEFLNKNQLLNPNQYGLGKIIQHTNIRQNYQCNGKQGTCNRIIFRLK